MATTLEIISEMVIERDHKRCVNMISEAIEYSFLICRCGKITRAEIKRRLDICVRIFCDLRAEVRPRYTLDRIEECLRIYLVYELEGQSWEPLKRKSWVPGSPISLKLPKLPDAQEDPKVIKALEMAGIRVVRSS
jgi:hypothetical protein